MSYCEYAKDLDATKLREKLNLKIPKNVDTAMVWYNVALSAPMLQTLCDLLEEQIEKYVEAREIDRDTFWDYDYILGQALYGETVVAYNKPEAEAEDDVDMVVETYSDWDLGGMDNSCWLYRYGLNGETNDE